MDHPIRSTFEGDADMLELIQEFVAELPARAARLEQLLADEAWTELRTCAHQLKGAGGGYGFPQITDAAALLERAVREGVNPAELKDRLRTLCGLLRAARAPEAR